MKQIYYNSLQYYKKIQPQQQFKIVNKSLTKPFALLQCRDLWDIRNTRNRKYEIIIETLG